MAVAPNVAKWRTYLKETLVTMTRLSSSSVLDFAPVKYEPSQLNLEMDAYGTEAPAGFSVLCNIVHNKWQVKLYQDLFIFSCVTNNFASLHMNHLLTLIFAVNGTP